MISRKQQLFSIIWGVLLTPSYEDTDSGGQLIACHLGQPLMVAMAVTLDSLRCQNNTFFKVISEHRKIAISLEQFPQHKRNRWS